MLLRHCCRFWQQCCRFRQQCRTKLRPFDKVETNWTRSICFDFAELERTKFRLTLTPKTATMSKQHSTLSKGRNFAITVRHCCRLCQQSRTLLRHCCWCGRGFSHLWANTCTPDHLRSRRSVTSVGSLWFQCTVIWKRVSVLLHHSVVMMSCIHLVLCTGSAEERGLTSWHEVSGCTEDAGDSGKTVGVATYELPLITQAVRRSRWTRYVPVCSTFSGFNCRVKCRTASTSNSATIV